MLKRIFSLLNLPVPFWLFPFSIYSYLSSSLIRGICFFLWNKWWCLAKGLAAVYLLSHFFSWLKVTSVFFSLQNPICCHCPSLRWMEIFSTADLAFATYQLITPSFSKLSAPAECNSVQDACQSARAASLACSATLIGLNSPWNISMYRICGAYTWDMFFYMCNSQSDAHFWMLHTRTDFIVKTSICLTPHNPLYNYLSCDLPLILS